MNGDLKIYIDPAGVSHNALVTAPNPASPDVLDLVYVHPTDGIKQVYGILPATDPSKKENNPDLPSYPLNAWKNPGDDHLQLPADHPNNDHPFATEEQKARAKGIQLVAPIQRTDVTVEDQPPTPKKPDVTTQLQNAGPAPVPDPPPTSDEQQP